MLTNLIGYYLDITQLEINRSLAPNLGKCKCQFLKSGYRRYKYSIRDFSSTEKSNNPNILMILPQNFKELVK